MLGSAEKAGSGVDKILKGWKESNWRSPIIETKCQPDKVELSMSMKSVMDDAIKEKLIHLFGESILNIDHNRLLILNIACADGFVSNETVRFVLNKYKSEITEFLKKMCKEGFLISEGYGRGTKYRLPKLNAKVATSDVKVATSDAKVATENHKKRLSKDVLQNLIINVCEDWKTMEEISLATNRNYGYLRIRIIPEMIKMKKLEMLFPGVPNHPNQKYKRIS